MYQEESFGQYLLIEYYFYPSKIDFIIISCYKKEKRRCKYLLYHILKDKLRKKPKQKFNSNKDKHSEFKTEIQRYITLFVFNF
jgi:hypothetical protein